MKENGRERVLTKAEQKRTDRFNEICTRMEAEGYERHDLIIDLKKANLIITLIGLPFAAASIFLFWKINGKISDGRIPLIPTLLVMLVLTVVHELVHGATWSLYCENGWKDIDFGLIVRTMNPYCTCASPLPKSHYVVGALAPLFLVGIVPYIAGLFMANVFVFFQGIVMVLGAGGDIMLVNKLLKFRSEKEEEVVYDHPTEAGSVVFTR